MKKLVKNFPCKCGHKQKEHQQDSWGISVCWECTGTDEWVTDCDFEPDNLKYLEMKYKEKKNG